MDKAIKGRLETIRDYEFIEGYKSTEIGLLPTDWSVIKLSDITEEITQTAGTDSYETVSISAGIGFVNQAVKFGKELSGKQYEKYTVLQKGDFSYNKGNSNKDPQGCIYRLKDRKVAAVPNVFESFRVINQCAEYYDQLFISGFLNKQLARMINHGVRDDGLLNLTAADFYSCILPLPPLNEQQQIAQILEYCDHVIELYEEKADKYRQLKRTCLSKMFPQKGNQIPEWRFPGFTDDWEQRKLGDITVKIGSGKTPLGGKNAYIDKGTPLIRSQNINNDRVNFDDVVFIDDATDNSMENSRVHTNDVLLNITGASIGRSAVYRGLENANVNQHVCIIRPINSYISGFIQLNLISDNGQQQIESSQAGGGREGLNFQQIGKMQFMFPTKGEQEQIVAYFNHLDHLIILHQREADECKRFKQALTRLLLTGIVRVNK